MAMKEYYIGSHGPYFYDDTEIPPGFSGLTRRAIMDPNTTDVGGTEVVTDVSLSIDFDAKTFNLTVTKTTL